MAGWLRMATLLGTVRVLLKQGEYEEAIEPLTELMELSESRNSKIYGVSLNMLGSVYYQLGKLELALDYSLGALAVFEKRKSKYMVTAILKSSIGAIYSSLGDPQTALKYEFQAMELLKKSPSTTNAANNFNNIATAYIRLARYDEARDYLLRALNIYERTVGSNGAECYDVLINLGTLHDTLEDFPKAIEYFKQALAVSEQTHGKNHPKIITPCISIGNNYAKNADYDTALKYLLRALMLLEETTDLDHPLCADCYDGLSGTYCTMGNYPLALEYRQKSIMVVKKTKGEIHSDMAHEYANLGGIYSSMGDYDRALGYLLRALNIRKKAFGTEHPDTADSYSRLGTLYGDMGNYAEALDYGFRALRIREKLFGTDHPDVGLSLNEIGRIYSMLNDNEKCLDYQSRALKIYQKTYGADNPKTARMYNNLGTTYGELNDPDKSLEYQIRALNVEEKKQGADHHSLALICHNIASAYADLHEYEEALQYNLRAMDVTEKAFGLEHPNAFPILNLFGRIYYEIGDPEKAWQCFNRLLEIQKKKYDPGQPTFIDTYTHITLLHYEAQNANVVTYAKKLMEAIVRSNYSVFYIPQEELRLSLLHERRKAVSLCFSVVFSQPTQFSQNELYAFELGTKNLVAETSFVQSDLANGDKTSEYAERYSALKELQILYAKYSLEGFSEIPKREDLERQILDREYALAPYYRTIDFKLHMQQATPDAIQAKLPGCAALLEYGKYYNFSKEHYTQNQTGAGERYFVFLIKKDSLCLFELGDSSKIDALIEQARELLTKEEDAGQTLHSLYQCLIGPVENELKEISQLFIAPDSELFKLPFELLQNEASERLTQRIPAISYVSTGRDLLRFSDKAAAAPIKDITIIADPEYDLSDSKIESLNDQGNEDRNVIAQTSRNFDGQLKADSINELPFTAVEAGQIADLFGRAATVLSGSKATETAIRQPGSPSVIHLSTHGFAFAPQNADIQQKSDLFDPVDRGSRIQRAENPMLRCGLAFAGICNWLKGETLPEEFGDGFLSGMDVLSLELSNTDLVVLPACQTGLGDMQTGEGIQGLRRAFELTGVHTLICTLWNVNDLASAILMTAFYKNLLLHQMSKTAALTAAKEYTRTLTSKQLRLDSWSLKVDDLNSKGFVNEAWQLQDALDGEQSLPPFAHPYFWAGFVLQGEE